MNWQLREEQILDRDFLRAILLVAGLALVLGIYFWEKYKQLKMEPKVTLDERDEAEDDFYSFSVNPADETQGDVVVEESEGSQCKSIDPYASELSAEKIEKPVDREVETIVDKEPVTPLEIVQLLIVPRLVDVFEGADIESAASEAGLHMGQQGVLQFYRNDKPVFSVVSMVEPGAFPLREMTSYQTPGLVFFFQPSEVSDPQQTLDDLVETCHFLADRLEGFILDSEQNPLTNEIVARLRDRLLI